MTHDPHDPDAEALGELISTYLDQHSPQDSDGCFDDILSAREAAHKTRSPRHSFLLGAASSMLLIGAGITVLLLWQTGSLSSSALEPSGPRAMAAEEETYGAAPKGWSFLPSADAMCEVGISHTESYAGTTSSILRSGEQEPEHFCALSQSISSSNYQGKRVRFSAWVRSEGVVHGAGLWMRVDGPEGKVLSFDNMSDRPIRQTRDWQHYAIILDVPPQAHHITYGALLTGEGKMLWDAARLEVVDEAIPTTSPIKSAPHNTDFEE